ncbi:MAG: hypothetical protein MJ180_00055 [Candidatus Gastranaerophilales bacterium]|nr:hypothetical protein [Candidatus Gastranaerophilales bacterium]
MNEIFFKEKCLFNPDTTKSYILNDYDIHKNQLTAGAIFHLRQFILDNFKIDEREVKMCQKYTQIIKYYKVLEELEKFKEQGVFFIQYGHKEIQLSAELTEKLLPVVIKHYENKIKELEQ